MGFLDGVRKLFGGSDGAYHGPERFVPPRPEDVAKLSGEVVGIREPELRVEYQRLGPIVSQLLADAGRQVVPGMTTRAIADGLSAAAMAAETLPAMLGYRGFPESCAISINEEIVHGIPGARAFAAGDLVKIEFSIVSGKGFASQSWTFVAGNARARDRALLRAGPKALRAALATLKDQVRLGDIGAAIQGEIEGAGLSVVRDFVGYGMGKKRIDEPQVKGYGKAGFGPRLKAGTILNIHVIAKQGTAEVTITENDWAAVAADAERGALFTCMAEITADGHHLLTPLLDDA